MLILRWWNLPMVTSGRSAFNDVSSRYLPRSLQRISVKTAIALFAAAIITITFLSSGSDVPLRHQSPQSIPSLPAKEGDLPCRSLPGADDVVVVMKTGSTELLDKFSIHLQTTFRCYPHSLIFSDHEETFLGALVLDALQDFDPKTKKTSPDFALWRRLRQKGRAGLTPAELSGPHSDSNASKTGNPTNTAWKLDKWKFLPMANRTLHEQPDKKWYLFVEADTYIFWQTLLNYLRQLDWRKSLYIGNMIQFGDIEFAHGGTGFVLSHSALNDVVQLYKSDEAGWNAEVEERWAGDATFGKIVKQAGAHFISADPIFQGNEVGSVLYDRDEELWCAPSVSYHHISRETVEDMWQFEQEWIAGPNGDTSHILRHCDVFDQYVLPRLTQLPGASRSNWTNNAEDDQGRVKTLEECRAICAKYTKCVQYRVDEEKKCKLGKSPKFGEAAEGVQSGWMLNRVKDWRAGMRSCPKTKHQWRVAES